MIYTAFQSYTFLYALPQMDSGGPILWMNPTTRRMVLVGIISGGMGCASDEPAMNTRVGAYILWISSKIPRKSWQIRNTKISSQ